MQPSAEPTDPRVPVMVDAWTRKLIDLTRRNRALNFRPTRVSTVAVIDEIPAEVFRRLHLRELSMRFRALDKEVAATLPRIAYAPEPTATESALEDAPPTDDACDPPAPAVDAPGFVPYESTALPQRHADDWLQTASLPDALDQSLRRIDEMALTALEEQGVNTLYLTLGLLHFVDSEDNPDVQHAPLVMLPVELTRKSARSGYALRASEQDPIVNPALAELLRRNFGITLPELPGADAMAEDYDLQTFFAQVDTAIASQKTWSLKTDIFLALFSFQKLVMYTDLAANAGAAAQHRLIRQLATREGSDTIGLPEDVRKLDLDREFAPESTFQIVDADASQLRAIAAVSRNHDLVIEGPPGTGKSQTITNLIATALASGKSVLFVAEKKAALSVVHSRLVAAGLGEFCLELHATKANKRAVLRQVGEALDASLQAPAVSTEASDRLASARSALTGYVHAVHDPFGALALSPYHIYAQFAHVLEAPRFTYDGEAEGITALQLEEAARSLDKLAAAVAELTAPPAEHPWRDATRTAYFPTDLEEIEPAGRACERDFNALADKARDIAARFGFATIDTFSAVAHAEQFAAALAKTPGVPGHVLTSEAWDAPRPEAVQLIERVRETRRLRGRLGEMFVEAALHQDHADDIRFVEERLGGSLSFLAFINARFRAVKSAWIGLRRPDYRKPLAEQARDLRLVEQLRRARADLQSKESLGVECFGAHWRGEDSEAGVLDAFIAWVVAFRALCRRLQVNIPQAALSASAPAPDVSTISRLVERTTAHRKSLTRLVSLVGWPEGCFDGVAFGSIAQRAAGVARTVAGAVRWASFEAARQASIATIARDVAVAALENRLPLAHARQAFLRGFYARWLAGCMRSRPELERFNVPGHEERVTAFRRLDEQVLQENRARLIAQMRDRVQARLKSADVSGGMPLLRRELARQRGHQPLRRTMREAEPAIRAIKPCFMMSPLTVAQYLDGSAPRFDVVIFDEASQLPAEDAAGAIIRGRQLVVVGDPKQLPPTSFFTSGQPGGMHPPADDATPPPDPESVLEDFMGTGMPMSRLKWHYRSAHESLIGFSNAHFYDAGLCTFPSVQSDTAQNGLQFEFVETGLYEGRGLNAVEARRVADAVVVFAREQLQRGARGEPAQSLGVGTFNLRQQLAIQDELEKRRRDDPGLEPFFIRDAVEPFFVKNLENIQGDERDVIFLSVTYARGSDGKLRYNFGPLNGDNGWRRLNVLTTRARQRMRVFSSIRGDDISAASAVTPGPRLLRDFLHFAERGGNRASSGEVVGPVTGATLEHDLARALAQRGVQTIPQVGLAGYRIDLGVIDETCPGGFLCGIECDGANYRASETARDRDRLRQQVLEARGWTILRVWSTGWFLDRAGQIDRLAALVAHARRRTLDARESAQRLAERSAREAELRVAAEAEQARRDAEEARKLAGVPYARPKATPYVMTTPDRETKRADLHTAPDSQVVNSVVTVVKTESPIHQAELVARVASLWETRVGSRLTQRVALAAEQAERGKLIRRSGDFWWTPGGGGAGVRSRADVRMSAERIAPEEYAAAILQILAQGHGFSREQLVSEVRAILGFNRVGPALDEAVRSAINDLLNDSKIGEGSTGIRIRR